MLVVQSHSSCTLYFKWSCICGLPIFFIALRCANEINLNFIQNTVVCYNIFENANFYGGIKIFSLM